MTAPAEMAAAGMIHRLRGRASHVTIDVIDPGVGSTPVRQALHGLGAHPEKPTTPPTTMLSAGIVVAATVVSAGIVNLAPAFAAFAFAGAVIVGGRVIQRRARRTDTNTPWASLSGQAFGAWEPTAPLGRCRLLVDQRGLAVTDLTTKRQPLAVMLWDRVTRLIVVPGRERGTDPGFVIHRADGGVATFLTSISTHEVLKALSEVGVLTDIEQAMSGVAPLRRVPIPAVASVMATKPGPAAPTAAGQAGAVAPTDPWDRVTPPSSPV